MPTIVLPNTQVDGDPADAAEVSQNLYTPNAATAASLAAINGVLDKDNFDPATLPLGREVAKYGAFADGEMVGATANQDYFSDWFESYENPLTAVNDAAIAVPGASVTYRLPVAASVVYIKWQISVIVDGLIEPGTGTDPVTDPPNPNHHQTSNQDILFPAGFKPSYQTCRLKLFVDGRPVERYVQAVGGSRYTLPDRLQAKNSYPPTTEAGDQRHWTCVAAFYNGDPFSSSLPAGVPQPWARGFHTAELRIIHAGSQARVKVRNMSYRYVR
jgi:hypothetical protein